MEDRDVMTHSSPIAPEPLIHECSSCGIGPCDCAHVYRVDDPCGLCHECLEEEYTRQEVSVS